MKAIRLDYPTDVNLPPTSCPYKITATGSDQPVNLSNQGHPQQQRVAATITLNALQRKPMFRGIPLLVALPSHDGVLQSLAAFPIAANCYLLYVTKYTPGTLPGRVGKL